MVLLCTVDLLKLFSLDVYFFIFVPQGFSRQDSVKVVSGILSIKTSILFAKVGNFTFRVTI